MFRIIVLLFGLTLHWSSEQDLDLLNTVSTRTLKLGRMSQVDPLFYDDWKAQEIAQKTLTKRLAEKWISNLSTLSEWYKARLPSERRGIDDLIRQIIFIQQNPINVSDYNYLFPNWSQKSHDGVESINTENIDKTQLEQSINILNACYMQGSDYYPGWGYKQKDHSYYCGQEVSREFINSYWMNEKQRVTVEASS